MKPKTISIIAALSAVSIGLLFAGKEESAKELVYFPGTVTTRTVVEKTEKSDAVEGCMSLLGNGLSSICARMGCDHRPSRPATWREEITTTKIIRVLEFEWQGKRRTITDEEVIDRQVKRFELTKEWKEVEPEEEIILEGSVLEFEWKDGTSILKWFDEEEGE